MNEPTIHRNLLKFHAYQDKVIADFTFAADFRSTVVGLSANLSVHADKTVQFREIEQMADREFLDLLRTVLNKASREIV